ncbi:MAG: GGDEF domain-containing protein [Desulfuromonadales bacterium]|nr:GGDEF domain-containing protein [Desulfuromonadales bacterium]MBN2791517.1 GGDEF domain-containing protein [Desulfuromonadales bacterium]
MPTKEQVLQRVIDSGALPTLSTVASKLINITGKEETTIYDITKLIAQDVSLSTKILKVVNSSFYNFPNEVGTIQQAVAILGTNAVRSLVLSFSFLNMERPQHGQGFNYERFWEESLAAAVASKLIMARVSDQDPEEVFTVSLLQNLGKLILACAYRDTYDLLLEEAAGSEKRLLELEDERIGANHAYIGGEAAKHWNFPDSLAIPIACHHDPDSYSGDDPELKTEIRVVHLAALVANILYSGNPIDYHAPFRERAKKMFKLETRSIDEILEQANIEVAKAADYFGLNIEGTASIPELLQKANIELSLLNMSYEQMNRELVEAKMQLEKLTTELEEKNNYLEGIANLDGLTEIYNHRFFQEFLDKEISRTVRLENQLSLILTDIDNFKKFNDFYGHQAGDYVLREVARLCGGLIREYDLLARYGGEEFVFVFPETGETDALTIAEKIRTAIEQHPFSYAGDDYRVTSSFGLAVFDGKAKPIKKSELIERADKAMYAAKKKGRNRVEAYAEKSGWFGKSK